MTRLARAHGEMINIAEDEEREKGDDREEEYGGYIIVSGDRLFVYPSRDCVGLGAFIYSRRRRRLLHLVRGIMSHTRLLMAHETQDPLRL